MHAAAHDEEGRKNNEKPLTTKDTKYTKEKMEQKERLSFPLCPRCPLWGKGFGG
jgi:hypothetical protein